MILNLGTGWQVDLPDGKRAWLGREKGWTARLVEEAVETFLGYTPTDLCDQCGEDTTGCGVVCLHCFDQQVMEIEELEARVEELEASK